MNRDPTLCLPGGSIGTNRARIQNGHNRFNFCAEADSELTMTASPATAVVELMAKVVQFVSAHGTYLTLPHCSWIDGMLNSYQCHIRKEHLPTFV